VLKVHRTFLYGELKMSQMLLRWTFVITINHPQSITITPATYMTFFFIKIVARSPAAPN
jgi:hypothetical protein